MLPHWLFIVHRSLGRCLLLRDAIVITNLFQFNCERKIPLGDWIHRFTISDAPAYRQSFLSFFLSLSSLRDIYGWLFVSFSHLGFDKITPPYWMHAESFIGGGETQHFTQLSIKMRTFTRGMQQQFFIAQHSIDCVCFGFSPSKLKINTFFYCVCAQCTLSFALSLALYFLFSYKILSFWNAVAEPCELIDFWGL